MAGVQKKADGAAEEADGTENREVARRGEGLFDLAWPENMQEFMGRMFEPWGFHGPWWRSPQSRFPARPLTSFKWSPATDVFERDGNIVVRADIPGMKAEDIDVSLQNDVLTIRGSRKEESEVKEESYHRAERSFGEFVRSVRVPVGTKADEIKASFKDGVLEVVAPLPKAAEHAKVKVDVG